MQSNLLTKSTLAPKMDVKKMVMISMFSAISYLSVFVFRVPVVLFLDYEVKDIIIAIAGFILGPMASLIISLVVSIVEMITISDTGPIGALMNFISSAGFACSAAIIYKRFKSLSGAFAGLFAGTLVMTILMLLWNYIITPFYMGVEREVVAGMLLPVFLPYNLLKAGLNSAFTLLLYRPLSAALSGLHILPVESRSESKLKSFTTFAIYAVTVLIIAFGIAIIVFEPLRKVIFPG